MSTYGGHQGRVRAIQFPGAGKVVSKREASAVPMCSAADDGQIQVWDVSTTQSLFTRQGHEEGVRTLASCREERDLLISGGNTGQICL